VSDQQTNPVLDAETFQHVLEAAFVLQEHNRKMKKVEASLESQSEQLREQELAQQAHLPKAQPELEPPARPNTDYTVTLAEIVEAQHQIQMRRLELDAAMNLVAERIARITKASGAGIGIIKGSNVQYRAAAGSPALPAGAEVPLKAAICQPSVRTGQVIRTKDVDTEFLFDPEPVRQRGIRSLVAVPIHYDGNIVGGLELYFDKIQGYAEQDIHTCQLMAGLVTEAMGRDAGLTLKKSMAEERSSMLAAIEKLQPNLVALAQSPSAEPCNEDARSGAGAMTDTVCWKCSNHLMAEEQFCGNCGSARASNGEGAPTTQGKLAWAWNAQPSSKQQANGKSFRTSAASGASTGGIQAESSVSAPPESDVLLPDDVLELFPMTKLDETVREIPPPFAQDEERAAPDSLPVPTELEAENPEAVSKNNEDPVALEQQGYLVWTSAARAQDFLESLSVTRTPSALVRFWRFRRGDFYLAIAVVLVIAVIGWGIWSSHAANGGTANAVSKATKRVRHAAPDADLSTFDKLLISVGLAEAPQAPEYKGNPDTQVWVDLNTAQYYCPGSDLYEKTAKGKLSSQREAQLDQFEPAYRKACD
jgi:putative methionine-R-sulfoxide reductase with GAF domain